MAKANTKAATTKAATATKTVQRATILKSAPRSHAKIEDVPTFLQMQDKIALKVIDAAQAIKDHNSSGLGKWLTLGELLVEYKKNWVVNGGKPNARSTKANPNASFLSYWKGGSFAYLSENDVSGAMFIAENWGKVSAADKADLDGSLLSGEVGTVKNAVKKAIDAKSKKAGGKAQGPANKNTSKKPVTAQSIVDTALATATKHDVSIADVLKTLKATLEKAIKKS